MVSVLICVGFRLCSVENAKKELTVPENAKLRTGLPKEKVNVTSTGVAVDTSTAKKTLTGK